MQYDVFVQDSFYKTVTVSSNNIVEVFQIIGKDISDGLIGNNNIKIVPVENNNNSEYYNGAFISNDQNNIVQKLDKSKAGKW